MSKSLYFGYMSNMSEKRMLLSCPSAKVKSIAKLEDHKLVFVGHKGDWAGACGNAVPSKGDLVWGVVWEINESDMSGLKESEKGNNIDFNVPQCKVVTPDGKKLECLIFNRPSSDADIALPSPQYVKVGIQGAIRNKLPKSYIDTLQSVETNNNTKMTEAMEKSLYPDED